MIELLQQMGTAGDVIAVVTAVVTLASVISNLTPTKTDDKVVAGVKKVLKVFGLEFKR